MMHSREALEIVMKLEVSPLGDNNVGMGQVQSQLARLIIQLHEISKGKEKCEGVWYITCKT
jgi:hypothetical protein